VDKNSLIGLGIIATILGVWLWFSGPSKEQIARNKFVRDSIETVRKQEALKEVERLAKQATQKTMSDSLTSADLILNDSVKKSIAADHYKDFIPATEGKEEFFTIENDLLKATILNKGAQIAKVELKKYARSGQEAPLLLFDKDSTNFSLKLNAYDRSRIFSTDSFYFRPVNQTANSITLRLQTTQENSFIDFTYSLKSDDYMVNSEIRFSNMQQIITQTEDQLQLQWRMLFPSQEKYIVKEKEVATVYYKQTINDPDNINPFKDEELSINEADIKWVSFKQQFFNSSIIADNAFAKAGSLIKLGQREQSETTVKSVFTELGIPFNHGANEKFGFRFYFGPNDYKALKKYELDLEKIIPTGWSIFSYINKGLVIPLFDALSSMNMGMVILIFTLIIKLLLLPIAYKTYLSGARMRVLKPELDAINAKLGDKADPMKKQQEQMALYRKAGVNPLSGCVPLLLQFPILIALFSFIPAAIQLRQKGFLWADDLSTYDSIWTFGHVPFINWAYGDHVSLFALLMFASTIVYTYMNQNLMPQQNTQMPGMKFMMYFMPVIFLAVMNKYAAGLSWYYFLANMITFLQNWLMKKIISDESIRAKIDANMKKPVKVSGFQKRLEEMQRQQKQKQLKR
jgi:YidC/Oxa1 family membrane protein insertase